MMTLILLFDRSHHAGSQAIPGIGDESGHIDFLKRLQRTRSNCVHSASTINGHVAYPWPNLSIRGSAGGMTRVSSTG